MGTHRKPRPTDGREFSRQELPCQEVRCKDYRADYDYPQDNLRRAETWPQFLEEVKSAKISLGAPSVVWYRGQANADYRLLPSLYRISDGPANEKPLFLKYQQLAARFIPEKSSDWQDLVDLQHYGLPTRLLDWTTVLGVAVFFATLRRSTQEPAVFLLDPSALNGMSGRNQIISTKDERFSYTGIYFDNVPFAPVNPLAIEAPLKNDRIFAQRGVFTVHPNSEHPLEELCPAHLRKIVMGRNCVEGAREFLEHANINEMTVFPDFEGLRAYLFSISFGQSSS